MRDLSVFISHTAANAEVIQDAVIPALEAHKLKYHFVNWTNLRPQGSYDDATYGEYIDKAIEECALFIACVSAETVASKWVRHEVEVAFKVKRPPAIVYLQLDDTEPFDLYAKLLNVERLPLDKTSMIDFLHSYCQRHLTIA